MRAIKGRMAPHTSIRLAACAILASGFLLAGCLSNEGGDGGSADTAATPSRSPINCPRREADPLDATVLVGEPLASAQRVAKRHGCYVRVVKRNGKALAVTSDLVLNRINVVVDDGLVERIDDVY